MAYEEEDTCMSYEEEDTCMAYEEEDTCMAYEEEDTCTPLCRPEGGIGVEGQEKHFCGGVIAPQVVRKVQG